MVPGPYNERLGVIAGAMVVSGVFAVLSSFFWEDTHGERGRLFRRILAKPPFGLWVLAILPPLITAASEIASFYQTGQWGH